MKNIRMITFVSIVALFLMPFAEAKQKALPNHIKKILIVVAMEKEAKPIIASLKLKKLPHSFSNLPMQGYVGNYAKLAILLIINGQDPVTKVENVGTQAATLSAYLGINYLHPDLVINIGTAGGVEANGTKEKEFFISKTIYFYDRRIPFPKYEEYGLGDYSSPTLRFIWGQTLNKGSDPKLNLKPGIVCSGDSFDDDQTDYAMFLKLHCNAIDMEAAGVAWVSMLTKTPMIAIKGITNYVRGNNIHEQYQKNLPYVTETLAEKLKELLDGINRKY